MKTPPYLTRFPKLIALASLIAFPALAADPPLQTSSPQAATGATEDDFVRGRLAAGEENQRWSILPDGSLFLSPRIFGQDVSARAEQAELQFGKGRILTSAGLWTLHVAHGLPPVGSTTRPRLSQAATFSHAYQRASGLGVEIERRNALAAVRPVFEREYARIKAVTNVTAFFDYGEQFRYSLESGAFVGSRPPVYVQPDPSLGGNIKGTTFVNPEGKIFAMSPIPFPASQAERLIKEVETQKENMSIVVIAKGVFVDPGDPAEATVSRRTGMGSDSGNRDLNTILVVRLHSAEAFAVIRANSDRNSTVRVLPLGTLPLAASRRDPTIRRAR